MKKIENDIMFIERKTYLIISVISFIVFLIGAVIFRDNSISSIIISFIYLIASISITVITKSIYTENGGAYFKFIIVIYTFAAFENFRCLFFLNNAMFEKNILNYPKMLGNNIVLFAEIVSYLILIISLQKKRSFFNVAVVSTIAVLLFIIIGDRYCMPCHICKVLSSVICALIIYICIYTKFNKFIINKNINFFKINVIYDFFAAFFSFCYSSSNSQKNSLIFLLAVQLFIFLKFIIGSLCILKQLLSNPYVFLFDELYDENNKLEELNKVISSKNSELETKQEILIRKEQMFRDFFTNIPVPLAIVNNRERIIYCNGQLEKLFSANIKDIINRKITSYISIEEKFDNGKMNINNHKVDLSKPIQRCTFYKDDSKRYADIEIIKDESTETYILIFTEVTLKVNADKYIEEVKNKKFEEKMKNDFLSSISHDLKAPINVIYSANQLVPSFLEKNNYEKMSEYNSVSKHNCEMITDFTNILIDDRKLDYKYYKEKKKNENIVEIVNNMVSLLLEYSKNKGINLTFSSTKEDMQFFCNREAIQRIVMNIITNSIKYNKKNGYVKLSLDENSEYIILSIKDNGIGMNKKFLEKAFMKFSMEKSDCDNEDENNSSGIGLYIVKEMVKNQNGEIKVYSRENKGTYIRIDLKKEKI